ncbi:MAG: ATP-dependent RNA helicase RhlB, partial [Desulfobacterales bacterium]|nr:ATP-dependent RNA helicase RhlB [Desulfobacterales bacterium]
MKQLIRFLKNLFTGKSPDQDPSKPPSGENKAKPAPSAPADKPQKRKPKPKKKRWTLDKFQVDPEEGKTRFHDLNLPLGLMHAVCDLGFKYCTDIQAQLLPHTLKGQDATA